MQRKKILNRFGRTGNIAPSSFRSVFVRNIGAAPTLYSTQKPCGMTSVGTGFTLIELLVVVLIIGILAAVALPQYQKAVLKSRYVQLITITKTIAESAHRYYLANGTAPRWTELDVELPAGCTISESLGVTLPCTSLDIKCDFGWGGLEDVACFYPSDRDKTRLGYGQYFTFDKQNKRYCVALSTDADANAVCKGMGGQNFSVKTESVQFGSGQINVYMLP